MINCKFKIQHKDKVENVTGATCDTWLASIIKGQFHGFSADFRWF